MKFIISVGGYYIILALLFINPILDPLLYFFASYCKRRGANVFLPNRNCQDQTTPREMNGKSQNIRETTL